MNTAVNSETRFSDRVADYVKYRPGYPPEIIPLLEAETGLTPLFVIADVGSGTGISTRMLLESGAEVYAVEPNQEMRAAAEASLVDFPKFHSVSGSAQNTTIADKSVDLIVAAQAFHWFNSPATRTEFSRVLKPDGKIVLIWNERKLDSTPFLCDYEALLMKYGTDYAEVRHENTELSALSGFFEKGFTSYFYPNTQHFDYDGVRGRLLSSSYAPGPGHPLHEPMLQELRRIFDLHQLDGRVDFEYTTKVHIGEQG